MSRLVRRWWFPVLAALSLVEILVVIAMVWGASASMWVPALFSIFTIGLQVVGGYLLHTSAAPLTPRGRP